MSDKSPTSNHTISLPTGGGALKGLGETFSPDLHTGTGNFTVPISLPPGRNGFQPQLSLVYSTGNPNGPFGLGWSLSVPEVSRKTSHGVPRYRDTSPEPEDWDTFLLAGSEDLVPVPGGAPAATRYRPRTEGLFARIEHHPHPDPAKDDWEVRTKDGLVSRYGGLDARSELAAIADPDLRGSNPRLFAWRLTRTTDPFGNRIEYVYKRDSLREEPSPHTHHWDQLYLAEIWYVDYGDDPDTPQFLVKVKFDYEPRPDPFSDYRAGFEIRTSQRCTAIRICTYPDSVEMPVRTYELKYLTPPPLNGVSLLQQIRVVGHDGVATESLPPLEFGYTPFAPETKRDFFPVTGPDLPPSSLAHPDYEIADLFGNGLPDILEMNGTVRYWRNLGNGKFDQPRQMREAPPGVRLADPGVQLLDANGDARVDLLVTFDGELSGYYPLRFDGLWDRRSFQRYELAPSFNLEDPEVRLIDLTGDGVVDVIRSGTRLECFFNHRTKGWTPENTRWVERGPLEDFPNVSFADPRVKWADMNGDGLQDIVLVGDGHVEYWPSLGHGDWGKRIFMRNSPRFPYGYDPLRILLGDVDGDGAADLIYVEDTTVTIWINQSGNGWSAPITIRGTPSVSDIDAVRLADMTAGGVGGVLWSQDAGGPWCERMYFLDFTGGSKPYLMNTMDNHMGAVTQVEYTPSTRFYLDDQQCPATRWKTSLPFPVQVVSKVEVIDDVSGGKLTSEYRYHHGYWDGVEREFRGFRMVEQFDSQTFDTYNKPGLHREDAGFAKVGQADIEQFTPPTLVKTWFHQGPIGDEFGEPQSTDFSQEFWAGDPQVLTMPEQLIDRLRDLPRRAKRDAERALRGSILRTELYALDETDAPERRTRPYTVVESLTSVREEEPPAAGDANRRRIFFPHAVASRTTEWERGCDPLTRFTFTGNYDAYGQPGSSVALAASRGRDFLADLTGASPPPEPYLATHTVTAYARRDDDTAYIVNRIARTSTYELPPDGRDVISLRPVIEDGALDIPDNLVAQSLSFYDGPAFDGLGLGKIGNYGALTRSENLVLTERTLHEAYKSDTRIESSPEEPPYLSRSGPPVWTAEYPQEFRTRLPALAGYTYRSGAAGSEYAAGYFAVERRRYDFQDDPQGRGKGLVVAKRDPLGDETTIAYDMPYGLLATETSDPVGLITTAEYDYRVLQASYVTDPNGNRTRFVFTPLELMKETWVLGELQTEGDRQRPSVRLEYDFNAFARRKEPVFVRTIRHIHHDTETDVPQPLRDHTIETVEYSDGFGRVVQTRSQAEDVIFDDPSLAAPLLGGVGLPPDQSMAPSDAVGLLHGGSDPPQVVVSGWHVYDNKGQVVQRFEPFFDTGWAYRRPRNGAAREELGQSVTIFYDPRGRVIRTVNPDNSEQRVIYGVPDNVADPTRFRPTPWEVYAYDTNDNAGRTHATQPPGASAASHWNTPASIELDALGRTVRAVERNRRQLSDGTWSLVEECETRSSFDIRGNLLALIDELGRRAFEHVYDLANRPLRTKNLDAGTRRTVLDAAGSIIELRGSGGALALRAYDALKRPIRMWARDSGDAGTVLNLRERVEYGDAGERNQPAADRKANRATNRLGRRHKHYDEAGLVVFTAYDVKGNLIDKTRQVIADSAVEAVFNVPTSSSLAKALRVDWTAAAAPPLDQPGYRTRTTYDALNRVKAMGYPDDVLGGQSRLLPEYNRAGAMIRVALEHVDAAGNRQVRTYVEHIAYSAKGQRTLIAYGRLSPAAKPIMTRYAYDQQSFRLVRMRTERYTTPAVRTYHPDGGVLQDLAYEYDLTGNVIQLHERAPQTGIPNTPAGTDALDRRFVYDPRYRLVSATGRECDLPPPPPPWQAQPRGVDLTRTRPYEESYRYDPVGNLTQLRHTHVPLTGRPVTSIRVFQLASQTNRLQTITIGTTPFTYVYDDRGNLVQENTERRFRWDHTDRLVAFETRPQGGAPASKEACYLYGADGKRVKKWVRYGGAGTGEATVYVDGIFEHHSWQEGRARKRNNRLHVMDNESRIAMQRIGDVRSDDTRHEVQFHLEDHLRSVNVVTSGDGAWVSREEYSPYGETTFGSFARKRYRFSGKERDEETGLSYQGARYYAPWLARWISRDPSGSPEDGTSLYVYVRGSPLRLVDQTGEYSEEAGTGIVGGVLVKGLTGGGGSIAWTIAKPVVVAAAIPVAVTAGVVLGFGAWVWWNIRVQQRWTERIEAQVKQANEEWTRQQQEGLRRLYGERLVDERLIDRAQLDHYIRTGSLTFEWQKKNGARYWIRGDPREMVNSLAGHQVYEYRDREGQLLYVGRSGGEEAEAPDTWIDRLKNKHINAKWIGLAATVTITSALTLPEALALEQILIPLALFNKKVGEHSGKSPEGGTGANAEAGSKQPRYTFPIDVYPVREDPH
jgi:RHS repeat-associated protein